MKWKITAFLITFSIVSFSQSISRLDSLKLASTNQKGLDLLNTLNEISWEFKNSNIDSAFFYARKSLKLSKEFGILGAEAEAYNSLANSFEAVSSLDSALVYHTMSYRIAQDLNDSIKIANSLNNMGIVYDLKGEYSDALKNYFSALEIYETQDVSFDKVPMVFVNIGIVYKKQKAYDKVLSYYKKALKIYQDNNYAVGEVITTGNIGSVLLSKGNYEQSISYSEKAERLYDSLGYARYVPYMRNNIAIAKDSLGFFKQAKDDYEFSIKRFEADKNLFELVNAQIGLGNNLMVTGDYKTSNVFLNRALDISEANSFAELHFKALGVMAKLKSRQGDFEKAYQYHQQYVAKKDSVFEEEKTKMVFELETKYETSKKDKEILSQKASLIEQEVDLLKKNNYILLLVSLAVILILIGYMLYKQQRSRNERLIKETKLKEIYAKIETQNQLQDQRLRISRDLHDNIGAQLTFVISSLDNLKYANTLAPKLSVKLSEISRFTAVTILELRDTIWAMNKDSITLEDLFGRLGNYIEKANLAEQKVNFQINIDAGIDEQMSLSSIEGINIYRIIQEGLNNAIKYSEASTISLRVSQNDNETRFHLYDNGIGFNFETIIAGNGIENMKKRAQEIKARFKIISKENEGTDIELCLFKDTE